MKKNSWISIITAIFLFVILGLLFDSQTVVHIDNASFKFFEMIRTDALDDFCYFLRDFGASKVYLTLALILLIYSIFRKKVWTGIAFIITLLTGREVVGVLKGFYERPRPTSMYYVEHGFSFPSGHAVMATCFFLTLCFILLVLDGRLIKQKSVMELAAILIILLISFSRVYLHVHHLSDIIAGWLVGYAWYSICKNTFIYLHEKKQI